MAGSDHQGSGAGRLLLVEKAALMPVLRQTPEADFQRPTICAGWSVRDVLGHCAAALTRVSSGNLHGFTPDDNERDVQERRRWPLNQVLQELDGSYEPAAQAIDAAAGRLDIVAFGEWVHGGDVREALGVPGAYAGEGVDDALGLLARFSRRRVPPTEVVLRDRAVRLRLGPEPAGGPVAEMVSDAETLVRLCTGRSPDPARLQLAGADVAAYRILS